ALFVAALAFANIALSSHGLVAQMPTLDIGRVDYSSFKAAGIGLASLASVFALARASAFRLSPSNLLARLPALDCGLLCFVVAVRALAGLLTEGLTLATPFAPTLAKPAWGPDGAWLLCLTGLALTISLWTPRARQALRGLLIVALVGALAV